MVSYMEYKMMDSMSGPKSKLSDRQKLIELAIEKLCNDKHPVPNQEKIYASIGLTNVTYAEQAHITVELNKHWKYL